MSNQLHLLKSRRFLPLFITQFFGAFNDNVFKNALLIWLTYDVAVKSGFNPQIIVTIAAGLFIAPFFLFSAIAGQFADKYEKSKLIRKIKFVEILLAISSVFGFYTQDIYLLLTILFLMGTQSTFFGPLKYSLLPLHLKDQELISGNGLIESGTFIAILLGTIIGGLLIRADYGIVIISIIIISSAIIGWVSSLSIPRSEPDDVKLKISLNIFTQSWRIINYSTEKKSVFFAIIGISWFWFIGATFLTMFPIYTKNIIYGDEMIVTLFLTIFSIGIAIGSVICNKLLKGKINGSLVPWGLAGITVSIICFFICGNLYSNSTNFSDQISLMEFVSSNIYSSLILLNLLFLSIFSGIYIVPLYAIIQHRSNEKHLARIIAANNIINALFMVLSSIGILLLFSLDFDVNQILLIVGILNISIFFMIRKYF